MAGVTVTVVLVILTVTLSLLIVPLILWLKRKTKKLNNNENNPVSPQLSLQKQNEEENKRFSLANPTYQPTSYQLGRAERTRTPEHDFMNPLYSPVTEAELSTVEREPERDVYEYVETEENNTHIRA